MYQLKRIILVCLFVLVGFSAYAQTPTDRADFLTEKMNVLLNLSAEQVEPIRAANLAFFERKLEVKEYVAQTLNDLDVANELSDELREKIINKSDQVTAHDLEDYNNLTVKPVLSDQQYSLYIQNQTTLLQSVVDEFGE
jgi:hypothetical protein